MYARTSQEVKEKKKCIQRTHHLASIMVWWGVTYEDISEIYFYGKGIKTMAKVY